MDVCIHGRVCRWMDVCISYGCIDVWMYIWINGCVDAGTKYGCVDVWMRGLIGYMDKYSRCLDVGFRMSD